MSSAGKPRPAKTDWDIDHVANLARLALTPEEKERFAAQITGILAHIAQISEVDVSGVEPTAHSFPVRNVWAEDVPIASLPTEDALRNAPAQRDHFFLVPKVVE